MSTTGQTGPKTVIVTGGSQGIGAGVTTAFLERGYNLVASSRSFAKSPFTPTENLALVEGNIADPSTAAMIVETAIRDFGSIDAVVNNAGIFFTKPFTEYTAADFDLLCDTNLRGYINLTQLAVKQMLSQKTGGSVVSVSASLATHPIAGSNASVPMITKGGLLAITLNLAMEYAKEGIRFNAVAPGVVGTPMHAEADPDVLKKRSPMGAIPEVSDVVEAIVYLAEARYVTGEVLYVDAGAHLGKW